MHRGVSLGVSLPNRTGARGPDEERGTFHQYTFHVPDHHYGQCGIADDKAHGSNFPRHLRLLVYWPMLEEDRAKGIPIC